MCLRSIRSTISSSVRVLRHRHEHFARHQVVDAAAVGEDVFGGGLVRTTQKLEPARAPLPRVGLGAPEQVAFGQDADQLSLLVGHRQPADVAVHHRSDGSRNDASPRIVATVLVIMSAARILLSPLSLSVKSCAEAPATALMQVKHDRSVRTVSRAIIASSSVGII